MNSQLTTTTAWVQPRVARIEDLSRGFDTMIPPNVRGSGAQRYVPVSEKSFNAFESSCCKPSFEFSQPG